MNLHDAIVAILKREGKPLSTREICNILNKEKTYVKKDESEISEFQVHGRVKNYPNLFNHEDNGLIFLIENKVLDLLKEAWNIQTNLRNYSGQHLGPNSSLVKNIVPFLFIFKRFYDNPELSVYHFNKSFSDTDDIGVAFYQFGKELTNRIENGMSGKFKSNLKEFEVLQNSSIKELTLDKVCTLNLSLSNYPVKDFGKFFNEFICEYSQNYNSGQFTTPKVITALFYELSKNDLTPTASLYNPGAGLCTIPVFFAQSSKYSLNFFGEEINTEQYLLSILNLLANNIITDTYNNSDSLQSKYYNNKFDLILSVPPFGKYYPEYTNTINKDKAEKDITILFVDHILNHLSYNGKAIILINESLLYSKDKSSLGLREKLVKNELLEGIISLPAGILKPVSGIKTSILILTKKSKEHCIFIDCNYKEFYHNGTMDPLDLNYLKIASVYKPDIENFGQVNEPSPEYGNIRATSLPLSKIIENNYDLSMNRYLADSIGDENATTPLSDILSVYESTSLSSRNDLKYVNITDLNNTPQTIYLNEPQLPVIKSYQKGKFLDSSLLLVGSIPPGIKPTYFNYTNKPIVVSRNIYSFKVDTTKVDIGYLIHILSTKAVSDYLEAVSIGATSLRRFSSRDFLSFKIVLPSLDQQKEILKIKNEAIYLSKLTDAQNFAEKSGISAKSEAELLGFVKHEIGNLVPAISNDILTLQSALPKQGLNFASKISPRDSSPTFETIFSRITANIKDINNLMSGIQSIIEFGNTSTKKSMIKFKKYLNGEVNKLSGMLLENNLTTIIGINDDYSNSTDSDFFIDGKQFSYVIRNFIQNTFTHGYLKKEDAKTIIFLLNSDTDFYYLNLINDGEPFSSDFALSDFLSFGGRGEKSKGSGLGGYLMNKVIQNHGGTIDLMQPGTTLFLDSAKSDPVQTKNDFIKVGVHFQIKLPKE
jgi:hypothetical protein